MTSIVYQVLEKCLKLLFESRDLSLVKSYVQRQFKKLIDGKVNIQDYTFAKEYRGREYYRPGGSAPALELTKCVTKWGQVYSSLLFYSLFVCLFVYLLLSDHLWQWTDVLSRDQGSVSPM